FAAPAFKAPIEPEGGQGGQQRDRGSEERQEPGGDSHDGPPADGEAAGFSLCQRFLRTENKLNSSSRSKNARYSGNLSKRVSRSSMTSWVSYSSDRSLKLARLYRARELSGSSSFRIRRQSAMPSLMATVSCSPFRRIWLTARVRRASTSSGS